MKTFRLSTIFFLSFFMLTLVSCDKDDDKDKEPTKTALLTAKPWQGNRILVDGEDLTSLFDMDDTNITFNKNGTYLFELDGETDNGTWELTSNEQKLLMDKDTDGEATVDILKLSNTILNIKWSEEDPDTGEEYSIELRLLNE